MNQRIFYQSQYIKALSSKEKYLKMGCDHFSGTGSFQAEVKDHFRRKL